MGINPSALCFGKGVESSTEFLGCDFALVNLKGRQCYEKRVMLNSVLTVERIICFVAVCPKPVCRFLPLGLGQSRSHFVGNLNKQIVMVKRVKIPQIDFCHDYILHFSCR